MSDRIAWLIKRKLHLKSVSQVKSGSVLFTQRFDSGLRLNVHSHLQALDGGYVQSKDGLGFHELDPITEEDVRWVAERSWKRTEAILRKHGRSFDEDTGLQDPVTDEEPFLAECYAQAIAGKGTVRLGDDERGLGGSSPRLVAQVGGINVHAERVVDGRDRLQLERLCRYMLRPPLAQDRLSLLSDGRVRYEMKRAWSDGTRSLVLEPMEFIKRLCAFVPPPYMHTVRYFGVLAPHSALRAAVVPKPPPVAQEQLPLFTPEDVPLATPARASSRIAWAQLLKRVFKTDVSVYGHCGGNVRVTDAVTEREEIQKKLDALGLPSQPPGLHPARAPPQGDFDWDCVS